MSTPQERRQQIMALEPRLLALAGTLTSDGDEARALVRETLMIAAAPGYGAAESVGPEVWTCRLLRQRFYSVERDRGFRRARSAFAIELSYARKRAELAEAGLASDGLGAG